MEAAFKSREANKPRRGNHDPISLLCARSHMPTSTSPRQEARERGSENPMHTEEQNTDCTRSCRATRPDTVPQTAGGGESGHPRISGFGAQGGEPRRQSHEYPHIHTLTHMGFYKSAPIPLPLSAHTPSASCPPRRCHRRALVSGRVGQGMSEPSGDSWKCHSPTPSVHRPHPLGCTFHTHTRTHTPCMTVIRHARCPRSPASPRAPDTRRPCLQRLLPPPRWLYG